MYHLETKIFLIFVVFLAGVATLRLHPSNTIDAKKNSNENDENATDENLPFMPTYDEGLDYEVQRIDTSFVFEPDDVTAKRCPFYDSGQRFSCSAAMNEHDPAMQNANDARIVKLKQHLAKNKATLYFIGDSLSQQYFELFSCAMFYSGSQAKDVGGECREWDGQFKMCYVSAGTTYKQDRSVMERISDLNAKNALSPGSIIIANEGVWWRNAARHVDEKERVRNLNVNNIEINRGIKVFWRETLAQHFPSNDGTFNSKGWYNKKSKGCIPVQDSSKMIKLNQEINDILHSKNISIIPGFELSLSKSSSYDHLERKTPHCRGKGTDCTHWCTPSNTLHQLREMALESIDNWIKTL